MKKNFSKEMIQFMLSFSMAQKLKDAGFKMNKVLHQTVTDGSITGIIIDINFGNGEKRVQYLEEIKEREWRIKEKWFNRDSIVWMPSLSDLLNWLESKGFFPILDIWDYHEDGTTIYECRLREKNTFKIVFSDELVVDPEDEFPDDASHPVLALSREDAVAKAVLWVINNGKEIAQIED